MTKYFIHNSAMQTTEGDIMPPAEVERRVNAHDELVAALAELVAEHDAINAERDPARDGLLPDTGGIACARTILAMVQS